MSNLTYPEYKRPCGWQHKNGITINSAQVKNHESCDAIIIGAGYTGLAIAQQLAALRPEDDIRIIDADKVGEGSSGRNSGFLLENVFKGLNATKSNELYQHYQHYHRDIIKRVKRAEVGLLSSNILKGAATDRGVSNLEKLAKALLESGQDIKWLNQERIRSLTGSSYYQNGLLLPNNSLLNPFDLIQSLAKQLPNNITLYEDSPVLTLEKQPNAWSVKTQNGSLKAPKIFLANNAFAKHLGFSKEYSVTIYTYAATTEQLTKSEQETVLSIGQWGILPAHRLGSTFRSTDEGKILVRGMYSYEEEAGANVEQKLLASLKKRFPDIQSAQSLSQCWGGTTSLTSNGSPLWGELEPGLFTSIGCNGVGIIKSWMLGSELAKLSCKQPTLQIPELFGKPQWMPSEPFRKMGFITLSQLEKSIAGAEK